MESESIGLRPKQNLATYTRLKTLYYYVYEMAESFGVQEDALTSLEKGIKDRQIIKSIIIKYRDSEDVVRGKILITIDWNKHTVLAMAEGGNAIKVNLDKSIHSQISEVSDVLIEHVSKMRKELNIRRITTSYEYVDDIENDKEKMAAAMSFLGHVWGKKEIVDIDNAFTHTMRHISKNLEEVEITIMSS